jgi:hypothetical protein
MKKTADRHFEKPVMKGGLRMQYALAAAFLVSSALAVSAALAGVLLFSANAALEGQNGAQENEIGMLEEAAESLGADLMGCAISEACAGERAAACCGALAGREERLLEIGEELSAASSSLWEVPFVEVNHQVNRESSYDLFSYNCVDYSADLVERLRGMGYSAKSYAVRVNCSSGWFDRGICSLYGNRHMVVMLRLVIDPTLGKVIRPEDYWVYNMDGGTI